MKWYLYCKGLIDYKNRYIELLTDNIYKKIIIKEHWNFPQASNPVVGIYLVKNKIQIVFCFLPNIYCELAKICYFEFLKLLKKCEAITFFSSNSLDTHTWSISSFWGQKMKNFSQIIVSLDKVIRTRFICIKLSKINLQNHIFL